MSDSEYATLLNFLHSAVSNAYDIADLVRQNAMLESVETTSQVFCHLARALGTR
jgi:hypothetical protein